MKVILFRDYKEENWHSMDVYADSLMSHLRQAVGRNTQLKAYVSFPQLSVFFSHRLKYIRQFFRYCIYPIGAFFQRADVYHITDHAYAHVLGVLYSAKTIVTCHDLTAPYWMMEHLPLTPKKRIKYAVERWRLGFMRKAARIIAVSNATKNQIVKELGIPEENITVIPEGVDELFIRVTDKKILSETSRRIGLPKKYILHVGTTYYNKNIESLLKIFFSLARLDKELNLLKIGDPWTNKQNEMIQASGCAERVFHAGFVATEDLPAIYSLATILLQPSYAEGFGFTVLEAMACGCPVVVSDIPAMREMVADAGLYIHLKSITEDITTIHDYLRTPPQQARNVARGLKRASLYSWDKTSKQTYAVYKEVLSKKKE